MKKTKIQLSIPTLIVIASGLTSFILGTIVIVGWHIHKLSLIQIHPDFAPMVYNTAVAYILCGAGLLAKILNKPKLTTILGLLVSSIGILTLIEYLFGINIGIDELFMKHYITAKVSNPGRMAPNTALCFALGGISLILLSFPKLNKYIHIIAELLGSIITGLGIIAVFGYITGITPTYAWGHMTYMALHTAIGFITLGLGLLTCGIQQTSIQEIDKSLILPTVASTSIFTATLVLLIALNSLDYETIKQTIQLAVLIIGSTLTLLAGMLVHYVYTAWVRAKKLEETSKELLELASIVESSNDAIIGETFDGIITSWNPAAERIYGYTASEIKSKHISILVPPDRAFELPAITEKIKRGERTEQYETTHIRKDEKIIDVSLTISPIKDLKGKNIGLSIISRDITERKRAEKELRESEERTRLIIENALDAVIVMDSNGLITSWNPQAEVIFGWKNEEAIGKKMSETIIPPRYREAHEKGLKKFLTTGEGPVFNKRLELTALHRGGYEFPVELTVSPMKLEEEYIFSAFIRDVTKQKQAEQELKNMAEELARSNKELEQFAYVASHDLQEPLRKIIAFGDRLKSHCETVLDDKGLDSLEKMQNAAMRMRQLIDDLLQFSRVTTRTQPIELVNLEKVIQEVLSDLELRIKESDTKIEINKLPTINADKLQMNLLKSL